jgi:tetratricopeptide (TPR) repeat protein
MIKQKLILILISLLLTGPLHSAGNDDTSTKEDNYLKAYNLIKSGEKLEKKNKEEASIKKYKEALKYLIIENKDKPNQPDTLNYLGYSSRKLGDLQVAEEYYLQGLGLNPLHIGINEYLGELYVKTGRIDKAMERLKVLQNCNCEEFEELQTLISKN